MAADTIYEVSTQVMVSWAAPRLPCMLGSATLAMVVSSTCMMVASMIDTVIMPACFTELAGDAGPVAMMSGLLAWILLAGAETIPVPGRAQRDGGGQARRGAGSTFVMGAGP